MGLVVIDADPEKAVVVLDIIIERCKASVMEETTLRASPKALGGSGAVALVRRTVGLKKMDAAVGGSQYQILYGALSNENGLIGVLQRI